MQDVARVAGVSVSTVSAVVNNKGVIGPELTAKVRQAVEALRYYPHQDARGLRVGRSRIIGVVIADVTNPFYAAILRSAQHAAKKNGYDVMMCDSDDQLENERRLLSSLHARRVEGIVLAAVDSYEARVTALQSPVPIVFVDCVPVSAKVNCVVTNNEETSYAAIRYLHSLGHKRIVMITRRPYQSSTIERLAGYQRAMQEAGLAPHEEYITNDAQETECAYQSVQRLMRQTAEPPTALFSMNNQVSLGILQALRDLGVPCPGQVSVLGFDDPSWAVVSEPTLSGIGQPVDEIGEKAVELLFRCIEAAREDIAMEPERIMLKSSLCIRASTGNAPVPQPLGA